MSIIMYAEVYKKGAWNKVGNVFKSTLEEMDGQLTDRVYDGRNKVLFEILTGQSFKQNKMLTNLNHIIAVDGVPSDISSEVYDKFLKSEKKHIKCITLNDLISFDWNAVVSKCGFITEWQYKRLKENGIEPVNILVDAIESHCKVAPFEMDMILKNDALRTEKKYYVSYEYAPMSLNTYCKFFCDESIPALIRLLQEADYLDTNNVRIVYFYDA